MKNNTFIKKYIRTVVFITLCAIAMVSAAHAGLFGNLARFQKDMEMTKSYNQDQVLPDYKYYYTGRSHIPYAVIGIDPGYDLNSRFWNSIDTRQMVIEKVGNLMPTPPFNMTAARILDTNGKQIGIWFSYYPSTIVKFGKNRVLTVYSPYNPNRLND